MKAQPKGPVETYLCSYLVDWTNKTARGFRDLLPQPMQVFDKQDILWRNSKSCEQITGLIKGLLRATTNTVKNVICFGLGEFCRSAPEWLKRLEKAWDENSDLNHVMGCMIQHSMALTIAQLCRGNEPVPVLVQDPDYTEATKEVLIARKFNLVGNHGAGGFADINEYSIVISPYPAAPVKQIIADLARPMIIISIGFSVFNDSE